MRFRNKVVWITGASSGIGEALAYAFSAEGAHLVLTARRQERLEQVKNACKGEGKILLLPFDMTHLDCHATMVGAVIEHFGQVDVLVNNAGVSQRSLVMETDFSVDRRIMELNYFSVVHLTKQVIPFMLQHEGGHIVVVSSLLGKFSTPLRSAYCASKHALHGYFNALRAELYDQGIRVTIVCPGFVKTEVSQHALRGDGTEHGQVDPSIAKGLEPNKVAQRIVDAIHKKKEEVFIAGPEGFALLINRFAPGLFSKIIRKARVT